MKRLLVAAGLIAALSTTAAFAQSAPPTTPQSSMQIMITGPDGAITTMNCARGSGLPTDFMNIWKNGGAIANIGMQVYAGDGTAGSTTSYNFTCT